MRSKDSDEIVTGDVRIVEELNALDIVIHPRHEKQIRSHQLAGFHFLVKNLVSDKPGGCILAHAPGSGKTFMLKSCLALPRHAGRASPWWAHQESSF